MVDISVKKKYGERTVLDVEKLTLTEGKVYAVMGSNGSGKSTLAKILAGVVKGEGEIVYTDGKKPRIGYMPQKSFAFDMSLTSNMLLGHAVRSRREYKKKASRILLEFGLWSLRKKNAKKLSGGETEKLALARLMMDDYDLLILDEPTAAMDVNAVEKAESILKKYIAATNATVLLVTHSPAQAKRLADELIFLDDGRVTETGQTAKLVTAPETDKLKRFLSLNS